MTPSLLKLAQQNTPEARAELVLNITNAIFSNIDSRSDDELNLFAEIALLLYATLPVKDRLQLSCRLAAHGRTPVRLAMKLAEDELEVARPILTRGICFSQEHLLDLARRVSEKHLEFIARRNDLSLKVSDKLIERSTRTIRRILASNRDIRLSRLALQTLVRQSVTDVVLREDLVLRVDLPPSLCHQMLPHVDEETQKKLRGIISGALSKDKLNQIARLKQLRKEFGPALDTSDMSKLWQLAQDAGIELDDLVILLLQDNRLSHVTKLLAGLTRQPVGNFREAIYNGVADVAVEAALKLKLRPDTFALFAHTRCRHLRIPDTQADEWITAYSDALLSLKGYAEAGRSDFAAKRPKRDRSRRARNRLKGAAKRPAVI